MLTLAYKQEVLLAFKKNVEEKINILQKQIADLAEDSRNDSKGSAGDKHETGLSMMHLEQEKLSYKLKETLEQKNILDKIDVSQTHEVVGMGSLVKTNLLHVFVSCALAPLKINNTSVVGVSPQSPLGIEMMGKTTDHTFKINQSSYSILEIV